MVVLPYIKGTTDAIQRILKSHNIASAVKPHTTLRKMLVHPKDKIPDNKKCGVIYEVPCKNCNRTYVGETGRQLGVRISEHQKETEKASTANYTRSQRKNSTQDIKKSAITDHVCTENHVINWEGVSVIDRESERYQRWVREAIWISRRGTVMNRDEGAYQLSKTWSSLIAAKTPGGNQ